MRLRSMIAWTVSPMILGALAVALLVVQPLGAIPAARSGLDVAITEREAIHRYAVTLESDTLRVLGGLAGNTSMEASSFALVAWRDIADDPELPEGRPAAYTAAANAHAILVSAVDRGDTATMALAFADALETTQEALVGSNIVIDERLVELSDTAPRVVRLQPLIHEVDEHLDRDRAAARFSRALGQMAVDLAAANTSSERVTFALREATLEADRWERIDGSPPALIAGRSALNAARELVADGGLGPDALRSLWPTLQDALQAIRDARDVEAAGFQEALLAVEDRAALSAWVAGVGAVGLLVAAPASVWVLQRRVVRPILDLHEVAESISPDEAWSTDNDRQDELGDLSRSFAQMSQRISDTTGQLRAALEDATQARASLQQSYDRLAGADRLRRHILNTASHELRTPLTPMRTHLKLLADEHHGPLTDKQGEALAKIGASMDRLIAVVEAMRDYHDMQEGSVPVAIEPMDAAQAAHAAWSAARANIEGSGHTTTWEGSEELPARGDAGRLRQALDLLLSHVQKHTIDGGHITMRSLEGPALELAFDASADEEELEHLFEPFEASAGDEPSLGAAVLDLAIAQAVVARMGGELTARSERDVVVFRMELAGSD